MENYEVIPAFDMLLEELDAIIPELNKHGSQLMEEKNYSKAREIISKAESLIAFQDKVRALREEWLAMNVPITKKPIKKKKPVKRKVTKMLKQGLRTPNQAFHIPILRALIQLGGSGQVQEILEIVEEMMSDKLNKYDFQSIPSNPKIVRWRNNANWARWKLVQQGYLASDSPRGVWEITESGRQHVKEGVEQKEMVAEKPLTNYDNQAQSSIFDDLSPFKPGQKYHRQNDLHNKYGGNRQAGIAPCGEYPFVFLFTSPRGDEYGYQDGWRSDNEYIYTGEGQIGNMEMIRGNRAIRDHQEDGRALHLFKKDSSGLYEYIGQFEYKAHEIVSGEDVENKKREVIRFVLQKL